MKKHLTTVIIILVALTGLSLLLYPTVSDLINSLSHRRAIYDYVHDVEQLDSKQYDDILNAAIEYNKKLAERGVSTSLSEEDEEYYNTLLDITGTGIMGYIEIPTVNISLPIYHGTDESVLQAGVGHINWSSLPIGGESSHSILSAHRGLPSARLFTDINKLVQGDTFIIRVLNEVCVYEVDNIQTVKPEEVSSLGIEEGKDYCTLVTCTPYGINTHRLLVRGHRIETPKDLDDFTSSYTVSRDDASNVSVIKIIIIIDIPIAIIIAVVFAAHKRKRKKKQKERLYEKN